MSRLEHWFLCSVVTAGLSNNVPRIGSAATMFNKTIKLEAIGIKPSLRLKTTVVNARQACVRLLYIGSEWSIFGYRIRIRWDPLYRDFRSSEFTVLIAKQKMSEASSASFFPKSVESWADFSEFDGPGLAAIDSVVLLSRHKGGKREWS